MPHGVATGIETFQREAFSIWLWRYFDMLFFRFVSDLILSFTLIPKSLVHASSSTHTSNSRDVLHSTTVGTRSAQISSNATITNELIPGMVSEFCVVDDRGNSIEKPPCVAVCREHDSRCMSAASSISSTCAPLWETYKSKALGSVLPSQGPWSWFTSVQDSNVGVYTTTWSEYTSFSTVAGYSVIGYGGTTITPKYALGTPITHTSVYTSLGWTTSWLTAPTPTCRYWAVSWLLLESASGLAPFTDNPSSTSCGQCTIYGGTVDLLWWPDLATTSIAANGSEKSPRSAVLNGTTLFSPTVYISLHTISASDYCSPVGGTYSSTLLAMNSTDVSTQYHFGGKVGQTGANSYGPLNYSALTGLPPASGYENQPSCIFGGCETIYPIPLKPTLAVPSQIRSLDPAWANCAGALEGLYDPPIALGSHETTSGGSATYPVPTPRPTPSPDRAKQTWTANLVEPSSSKLHNQSLVDVLSSTGIPSSELAVDPGPRSSALTVLERTSDAHFLPSTAAVDQPDQSEKRKPGTTNTNDQGHEAPRSERSKTKSGRTSNAGSEKVVINGITLAPSQPVTIGSGSTATTVSLLEQSGSRFVVYGGTSTERFIGETSKQTGQQTTTAAGPHITMNSQDQYVVNGQTFAPSSPITLSREEGPVTYRMLVTNSSTYVAIGTSTTILLAQGKKETSASRETPAFEFTRASNGNFVLHGTTLSSGEPITVGSGSAKTTLRITTISSTPAIVLDGSHTRFLGHGTVSSIINSMSQFSAPPVKESPSATATREKTEHRDGPVSTASRSGSWKLESSLLSASFWSLILIMGLLLS